MAILGFARDSLLAASTSNRCATATRNANRFRARLVGKMLEPRLAFDLGMPSAATTSISLDQGNLLVSDIVPGGRADHLTLAPEATSSAHSESVYRIEDPDAVFLLDNVPDAVSYTHLRAHET